MNKKVKDPNETFTLFDNYPHVQFAFIDFMWNKGLSNGSFMNSLFMAFFNADGNNFARLAKGFPVVAEAVDCYQKGLNKTKFPGIIAKICNSEEVN